MSRRRNATKVVSYSEADQSFSDFVKTAHMRNIQEASKYTITQRKEASERDADEILKATKSPGLKGMGKTKQRGRPAKHKETEASEGDAEAEAARATTETGMSEAAPKEMVVAAQKKRGRPPGKTTKKADDKGKAPAAEPAHKEVTKGRKPGAPSKKSSKKSKEEEAAVEMETEMGVEPEADIHNGAAPTPAPSTTRKRKQPETAPAPAAAVEAAAPSQATAKKQKRSANRLSVITSHGKLDDDVDEAPVKVAKAPRTGASNAPQTFEELWSVYQDTVQHLNDVRTRTNKLREVNDKRVAELKAELDAAKKAAATGGKQGKGKASGSDAAPELQAAVDALSASNKELRDEVVRLKAMAKEQQPADKDKDKGVAKLTKMLEEKRKELARGDKLREELTAENKQLRHDLERATAEAHQSRKDAEKSEKRVAELGKENDSLLRQLELSSRITGLATKDADGESFTCVFNVKKNAAVEFKLHQVDNEWEYVPVSDREALSVVPEFLREEIVFSPDMLRAFFAQLQQGVSSR